MAQIRAMWVGQGASNLSEDRFVNTFHFVTPTDYATDQPGVSTALRAFYDDVAPYIQGYVKRAAEFRFYDLQDATPRVPIIEEYTMPSTVQAGGLPEECAACLSYHGAPPVTARRRGRIYLGPLVPGVVDAADTNVPPRIGSTFSTVARTAAVNLVEDNVGWSIYSPTGGLFVPIVGGWMDNAVDIQRRRGGAPTVRTLWNA